MKMVQYISLTSHLAPLSIKLLWVGRMPKPYSPQENLVFVEQANSCLVEQAGKPVHENGAIYQFNFTSCTIVNKPFTGRKDAQPLLPTRKFSFCGTSKFMSCGTGRKACS